MPEVFLQSRDGGHNSSKIAWNIGQNYFANPTEQMSSYQFVNSLTSCYGQRGPEAAASSPADYYSQQQAAYNSCYGASAAVAAAAAAPASPAYPSTAAYLNGSGGPSDHHNPHSHHLNAYSSAAVAAAAVAQSCAQQQPQSRHSHQSPVVPNRTPTPSSCKYAPVDSAASPQDLSTSSTGAGQSSESGSRGSPSAPARSSSGGQAQAAGDNNNSSKNSGQGQPQIYPWMRKVHVGQSKFAKSKCHLCREADACVGSGMH